MGDEQSFSTWDKDLLGIPIIDRQHANLIRIAKNLRLAHRKGSDDSNQRFLRAAQEALDYAKFHFNTEEKLMRLLEYPEYSDHKKEHEDFSMEILSRCKQIRNEQHSISNEFVGFLDEWIKSHINVSDRIFADYFRTMPHHNKLKILASAMVFSL